MHNGSGLNPQGLGLCALFPLGGVIAAGAEEQGQENKGNQGFHRFAFHQLSVKAVGHCQS
jgi:hypothetical protein